MEASKYENILVERWHKRAEIAAISVSERDEILMMKSEKQIAFFIYERYYIGLDMSQQRIGEMFCCSSSPVFELFGKYDLKTKTNLNGAFSRRKYDVDEFFFDVINTEEKAYWLGFFYADGYISPRRKYRSAKIGVSLAVKDKKHLIKLKECLKSSYPIREYNGSSYSLNKYCRLLIHSNRLYEALKNKGCYENKTFKITFPNTEIVPRELLSSFLRGYFDGDGSIIANNDGTYAIGVCGTKDFLEGFDATLLEGRLINKRHKLGRRKEGQEVLYIKIGGLNQAFKILSYLYENANIYLDRKYELYEKVRCLYAIKENALRRKCDICEKTTANEYYTWKGEDEYNGMRLCRSHFLQLKKYGSITQKESIPKRIGKCSVCNCTDSKAYHICRSVGEYYNKELCSKHYYQIRVHGKIIDYTPENKRISLERVCSYCGCTNSSAYYHYWKDPDSNWYAKELCGRHYQMLMKGKELNKPDDNDEGRLFKPYDE